MKENHSGLVWLVVLKKSAEHLKFPQYPKKFNKITSRKHMQLLWINEHENMKNLVPGYEK